MLCMYILYTTMCDCERSLASLLCALRVISSLMLYYGIRGTHAQCVPRIRRDEGVGASDTHSIACMVCYTSVRMRMWRINATYTQHIHVHIFHAIVRGEHKVRRERVRSHFRWPSELLHACLCVCLLCCRCIGVSVLLYTHLSRLRVRSHTTPTYATYNIYTSVRVV